MIVVVRAGELGWASVGGGLLLVNDWVFEDSEESGRLIPLRQLYAASLELQRECGAAALRHVARVEKIDLLGALGRDSNVEALALIGKLRTER